MQQETPTVSRNLSLRALSICASCCRLRRLAVAFRPNIVGNRPTVVSQQPPATGYGPAASVILHLYPRLAFFFSPLNNYTAKSFDKFTDI